MTPQCPPLLLIDVDGVISLFGFDGAAPPPGVPAIVDGIPHWLSAAARRHIATLGDAFECVWCTGWEDRANDHLPFLLGIGPFPHIDFDSAPEHPGHWKLGGIEALAGPDRPLAWIDDAHDDACRAWAAQRPGPTLLVGTRPPVGITSDHVSELLRWAAALAAV